MKLNLIEELPFTVWNPVLDPATQAAATDGLEHGRVLYLPQLRFDVRTDEMRYLSADWSDGKSKNIYLRGAERKLRGAKGDENDLPGLAAMLERFGQQAQQFVAALFPHYVPNLEFGNTSFRPCEIEGRPSSYRKDDTRLHPDAFPSNPTGGARILRVFTNVNPHGQPRVWRVGEPFPDMAAKFLPRVRRQWPGEATLLKALGITKRLRTEYDHLMVELHDRLKADLDYQRDMPQQRVEFPPGCTWVVFSDQVLHAVLSGRLMLEQTWMLPVTALRDPETAPSRVLERLTGRALL
ncbi:MAG: Kdo hydroxylase family protein [Betaproteobacteria bacterium]|nr:Kdo hydroxylase family protein [Betaproteobacteria bacterium]